MRHIEYSLESEKSHMKNLDEEWASVDVEGDVRLWDERTALLSTWWVGFDSRSKVISGN